MKAFYSDYSRHCLRFYIRHSQPTFKSNIDKLNWEIAEAIFLELTDREKEIITNIYKKGSSIRENIDYAINNIGYGESEVWSVINRTEKSIAIRRGLI